MQNVWKLCSPWEPGLPEKHSWLSQNPKMYRVPDIKHKQRAEGIAFNTRVWEKQNSAQWGKQPGLDAIAAITRGATLAL